MSLNSATLLFSYVVRNIGTFEDSYYDYWIRERDIEEMYGELLKVKIIKDCGVESKKQV